ncbi:MAG: MBOAT family protein [Leptospira sp.]|nr:MBOAT family protein [Leptospira sp.]
MTFVSLKFLLCFTVFYVIYWNVSDSNKRRLLLFFSCIFYSFFSFNFLLHFLTVISINALLVRFFHNKTFFLKIFIGFNLGNLVLFKYFYFGLEIVGQFSGVAILTEKTELNKYFSSLLHLQNFEIILPATISYYTFQFISLGIDLKRGEIGKIPTLYDVASYVLFFPVMIAGPILRFNQLSGQFASPAITKDKMYNGIWLVLLGIIKKVLLSDTISGIIYPLFSHPSDYSGISLLLTSYFFAFHLFLDFSGLTDMARGIGILLGFELPENFKAPFFLNSFGDFWRRWHLTFSFWIRDYIYIPLGGSRVPEFRNYLNFLVTFVLGGLWHGASMNFALWGFLTGLFLSVEKFFEIRNISMLPRIKYIAPALKYVLVLHVYLVSWVLFFTPDVKSGLIVMKNIICFSDGLDLKGKETGIYVALFTLLFHAFQEWPEKFEKFARYKNYFLPVFSVIVILMLFSMTSGNVDFFYSKF